MNVPYIIGHSPPPELPLGRFIPPIPGGMVSSWCHVHLNPGDWVLEPFGFNPMIPIEIAQSGLPVLVSVNNPIHAFMLRILASAPQEESLIAALQDLAVATKGEERMENYIRNFYMTRCTDCKKQIEVDAFLWKKDANEPYASIVNCPHCGARGEQILTSEAKAAFTPLPPKRLHLARALNRIVDLNDAFRYQVENALDAYPTRPLIILQTLINRLETLEQDPRRHDLLMALILSAADQGNTLWAYPSPRARPRQIVIPSVFQEKNLWKALENAVKTWQAIKEPVLISDWQGFEKDANGIYIFQGRLRELGLDHVGKEISAVVTAIPRPNQAFWTLSTLWTGWLWGKEGVAPIRNVLSRQRYDWNWHQTALNSLFDVLYALPQASNHFFGLIAENEPMLLLASLLAANQSGLKLESFAQSIDDQIAQCLWRRSPEREQLVMPQEATKHAHQRINEYLTKKGEPASYQQIHSATISGLAHQNKLAIEIFLQNPNHGASETQKWLESFFEVGGELTRINGESSSIETGDWWLSHPAHTAVPLIDRIEEVIVRHLIKEKKTSALDVKEHVYQAFPGIFTPDDAILLNCLESYADLIDQEKHIWQLRESEQPDARQADVKDIRISLIQIGERLKYIVKDQGTITWFSEGEKFPDYHFQVFSSSMISIHIRHQNLLAKTNVLVLPGSRSNLLAYKKQRDPLLEQKITNHYLIVKYRLIRDLAINPLLSRDLFIKQILADPPEYHASQLALF